VVKSTHKDGDDAELLVDKFEDFVKDAESKSASFLALVCIVLYCIVMYCIVLYCIVLYIIVLYGIALHVFYCVLYILYRKVWFHNVHVPYTSFDWIKEKCQSGDLCNANKLERYACMYVCMYLCVYMHGCMFVCMYACMLCMMHVCMYVCMY